MSPRISVIIPTYNAGNFIKEALVSAQAALHNITHEIIIVNDGSTDDTELVLNPWMKNSTYITQSNQGAASARNLGLQHAQGEYIAFIDADDVWDSNHGELLLEEFIKKPEAEIVMGCTHRFHYKSDQPDNKIFYGGWELLPSFGSALIKKDVFLKVGIIEPSYRFHEDVDWFLRAAEMGVVIAITPYVVSYYRTHDRNTTHNLQPTDHALLHVLASSLRRRSAKEIGSLRRIGI